MKSDGTPDAINTKTVRVLQFSKTSHNTGCTDVEGFSDVPAAKTMIPDSGASETPELETDQTPADDAEPYETETIIPKMLYQPVLQNPEPVRREASGPDRLIIHNSSNIPKIRRNVGALVYCFPTLFYYGCGGYEDEREVHMTPLEWVNRLLELPGSRFGQHYGFIAAAFDVIATEKAYHGQFLSMKVKKEAIRKHGLWTSDDIIECMQYKMTVEECQLRGSRPPPPPDKVKGLLSLIQDIKPGMANMFGSDESRAAARQVCNAFTIRMRDPILFITHSPDCGGTLVIAINTNNMEPFTVAIPNVLPNRSERKQIAAKDAYQSAMYAHRVKQAFIEVFLGWVQTLKGPKREGGALGAVKWFSGAGEPQSMGDIHFHFVVALCGFPPTSAELRNRLGDPGFFDKFTAFVDSIAPPHPPLADPTNACPQAGCAGILQP